MRGVIGTGGADLVAQTKVSLAYKPQRGLETRMRTSPIQNSRDGCSRVSKQQMSRPCSDESSHDGTAINLIQHGQDFSGATWGNESMGHALREAFRRSSRTNSAMLAWALSVAPCWAATTLAAFQVGSLCQTKKTMFAAKILNSHI